MLACAAAAQAEIPGEPEGELRGRARRSRATRSSSATTATRRPFGRTPNVGGVSGVRVPAKYDGFEGLPAKAADATSRAGRRRGRRSSRSTSTSRVPTMPAPPGGYPLIVFMHGCCAGDKIAWEATDFEHAASAGTTTTPGSRRAATWSQLHGARVPRTRPAPAARPARRSSTRACYEINDFQYLAGLVADDPFFNVNPQKVVADRRLLRRRLRLAGAHRPEVDRAPAART